MKIVRTKGVCGGQPRISGTRMTVACVLRMLAGCDGDINRVLSSYPAIKREEVVLCISYAVKQLEKR